MKLTKIAFGVALAAGTMAAHADSIFFPYVVKGGSVTTVINVIDTGTSGNYYDASGRANTGGNRLHYTLVNKQGAAALDNGATCGEVNYFLPSSPYDLQTIDLGAQFSAAADKGVLFNDPGVNNDWKPAVSGSLTYALAQAAAAGNAVRGYMVVDNVGLSGSAATLSGEAFVFEFGGGAAWGYQAFQQTGESNATSDGGEFVYGHSSEQFAVSGELPVSFMPLNETTTRFFVTPIGAIKATANHPNTNAQYGGLTTNVTLDTELGVAYDRDENLVSGSVPATVTCVGAVDVRNMLTIGAAAILENGGWGNLVVASTPTTATVTSASVVTDGVSTSTATAGGSTWTVVEGHSAGTGKEWVNQASVIKLEFNAAGTFNGQATTGTYNNAFQLRNALVTP